LQGTRPRIEALFHIHYQPGTNITPDKELTSWRRRWERWLPHPEQTVAVLVPEIAGLQLTELLASADPLRRTAAQHHGDS